MLEVIVRELLNLRTGVNDVEFRRAKAQLKSQLLMHMESRPVMFEDLGRQVLANNERQNAQYYIRKIGASVCAHAQLLSALICIICCRNVLAISRSL